MAATVNVLGIELIDAGIVVSFSGRYWSLFPTSVALPASLYVLPVKPPEDLRFGIDQEAFL